MLYIFRVDTGTMMQFEMSLAVDTVESLKQHIQKHCNLPADIQVLLVSGGQCLENNAKVCSFSAGTDTNPIFLFSKVANQELPQFTSNSGSELELTKRVTDAQDLPASYQTVVQRANLAKQFHELAKEQTKICEDLVHDQHLQNQGWGAVIANLEDLTRDFEMRGERYKQSFQEFIDEYDNYLGFLSSFYEDLKVLEKIPVLPVLLPDFTQEETATCTEVGTLHDSSISLLQWIKASDKNSTMDSLFQHCTKGLQQFNLKVLNNIKTEIDKLLVNADNKDMKEIKGLGERLFGLEQLMHEARRCVQEQAELAQSFLQNQKNASKLGDTSILPDLCASHKEQLLVMLENHRKLCDIRRRSAKAKEELCTNLNVRLQWVVFIETKMLEADHKMQNYHENIQMMKRHLEILRQIHVCPATYLSAITEVVRRREFSQAFLMWASELACHLLTIHNDEVTRRKDFQASFDGHFLNSLFPGLEDMPPSFATQTPSIFDINLPALTVDDIQKLKKELPELEKYLNIPDMSSVTNFFLVKSIVKSDIDKADERGVEEKLVQVVEEVGVGSNLDQNFLKANDSEPCLAAHLLPHLKDLDRGCESETDTEEFEKVCQSPLDLHYEKDMPSPRPGTQDASTLTEVGEKSAVAPRKPPRTFTKPHILTHANDNANVSFQSQRTLSISGSQSNTESFTHLKNPSLESIDELSSLKNFPSNTESCFNSHYQHIQSYVSNHLMRSKSLSPHTPQSPKDVQIEPSSPNSPVQGHQQSEFVTDEFYIDESLPSSLSIETGQSHGEFVKQLDTANNVVALLQDNLQISRTEHDKLKSVLSSMAVLSRQTMVQIKSELSDMKSFFTSEKSSIESYYKSFSDSWENLTIENSNKEREIIQRLSCDHNREIQEYKIFTEQTKEEMKNLQLENICLEQNYKSMYEDNQQLKTQLSKIQKEFEDIAYDNDMLKCQISAFEKEKEKCLQDLSAKLNREHRQEMENIRARYRFMTMEKSPSDTSLGKTERQDKDQESLIKQIREACDKEKDEAIKDVIRKESSKWQHVLEQKLNEMNVKYQLEKETLIDEVTKRISEDKEKQIDQLRERHSNLMLENIKYKTTIQQLAEDQTSSNTFDLLEKIEKLEREKCQLEADLSQERSKRLEEAHDMSSSVAVFEGKVDVATSPVRHREKLTKSQVSLVKTGHLNIDNCIIGDPVLVIWDKNFENYRILQESSILHFLHTDCIESLGLKTDSEDRQIYCTGEVYDKEYCHAKKTENRYKVPKGTKFYRVKVKPLISTREAARSNPSTLSRSQTSSAPILDNISEFAPIVPSPLMKSKTTSKVPSQLILKPDTNTLVEQSTALMSQSNILFKEIQKSVAESLVGSSQQTELESIQSQPSIAAQATLLEQTTVDSATEETTTNVGVITQNLENESKADSSEVISENVAEPPIDDNR